ncbi:MAG TPA: aminopeptidase [Bdellovibrionales bacterium]|nr:aminopeptidase [Bdellovibrionales bacterium]
MDLLKAIGAVAIAFTCSGCQISYYLHSAYNQSKLVQSREPIDKALRSPKLNDEQKRKLRLVQEVKHFAEEKLRLLPSRNYTSFVQLDEPYVTYVVQAAHIYELKPYLWRFPFVGQVPYKGYFRRKLADEEAARFDRDKYDTYVRGVTAYSTLGWFQDSVLSSMLRYEDHDLVELIIHETTHTTLFVKGGVDFNERLATFLGREGMKLFYLEKEGQDSPNLKRAEDETHDQNIFSAFITEEFKELEKWYESRRGQVTPEAKAARLKELQNEFMTDVRPKLKTGNYDEFGKRQLNNAYLLAYRNYEDSLEDFVKLHKRLGGSFQKTLEWLKTLKDSEKPDQVLKEFVAKGS